MCGCGALVGGASKRSVRIDLDNADLSGVSIDEEITLIVKGKVKELRAAEKPTKEQKKDGWEGYPAMVELSVSETRIDKASAFEEIAEEM